MQPSTVHVAASEAWTHSNDRSLGIPAVAFESQIPRSHCYYDRETDARIRTNGFQVRSPSPELDAN